MDPLITKMISKAKATMANSYAPYSKFNVGCCIETATGTFFCGTNVENNSYSLAICAESAAITAMIAAGEQVIKNVVVLAGTNQLCSPCGACRQRISEFSNDQTMIHMCSEDKIFHSMTMKELLPLAFDF
ncbi:MAG: cytidine deaminase [Legionella sp. 40-6]|nr:cytidine deaminase [Legionella sp.]OJY28966.1 MAG: cytidine deaminase [Legionella sp. 40-6]